MGFFTPPNRSPRLLLLSCSKAKRVTPGLVPARLRYEGPLWQTLRLADPTGALAACAVLSAWHGLLLADTPIENYDYMMNRELVDQLLVTTDPLDYIWPSGKTARRGGSVTKETTRLLAQSTQTPFESIALVGGALYLEVMLVFVTCFQRYGYINPGTPIRVINGRIGEMRRDLKNWLLEGRE